MNETAQRPSAAALLLVDQINQTDHVWAVGENGVEGLERIGTARLIDAYVAERERVARQTALEQACKAVCDGCAGGRTVENIRGKWWHPIIEHDEYYTPPMPCMASAIRALMDGPSGQPDDRYAFRRARGAIPYRDGQPMPEDVIRRMRGKDDEPM